MTISAYPLAWPAGWKRTPEDERIGGNFGSLYRFADGRLGSKQPLTISTAVDRVLMEVERLGVDGDGEIIVSTNGRQRQDGSGLPRSERHGPDDPGAAVYWTLDGERQCIAIDRYTTLSDNLAAIAATIQAIRSVERHGGAQILKRAFQGFKALPETSGATMGFQAAFGTLEKFGRRNDDAVTQTLEWAKALARSARNNTHPDRNGSPGDFQLVQRAAETLSTHYGVKL